jgi:hypothetical protein
MSGLRRNTKRTFTQRDTRSFYLAANDMFFGLVFASTQDYNYKINRTLISKPSILLYDNQTKVIIDYSNSRNTNDLSFVSSFFNSLQSGATFSIANATYIEDTSTIKANLSGVYTFKSFDQGTIVRANIVSTTTVNTKKDSYYPKFFTDTPQIAKASGSVSSVQQRKNIIKNTLSNGTYSFKRLGIQIGDYIDFSGTENNQWKKVKVLDIFNDTDGYEVMEVDTKITDENLIGEPVLINLYLEGESENNVDPNDKTYGTCLLKINDTTTSCIPCQNSFLCDKRKTQLKALSSVYTKNSTCEDSNIQTISDTLLSSSTTGITASQQTTTTTTTVTTVDNLQAVTSVRPKTNFNVVSVKVQNKKITQNGSVLTDYSLALNTTFKLLLSDPTFSGYSMLFSSTDPTKGITEITDSNVIKSGLPGSSNSYISIYSGTTAKTIYVTSSDKKLGFKVTIK